METERKKLYYEITFSVYFVPFPVVQFSQVLEHIECLL